MISKSSWNVYCTRFLVRARQLTEPIAFTDPLGHEHIGHPGDYLVETSNGIRRVATRAFFEDTYMRLPPRNLLCDSAIYTNLAHPILGMNLRPGLIKAKSVHKPWREFPGENQTRCLLPSPRSPRKIHTAGIPNRIPIAQ
ncbi:MAG: hypothetical protein WA609_10195 [Terriglobales bacterium]